VYNVAVLPAYRGRGYGRLMTERGMADAFGKGTTAAIRHTTTGFRSTGRWGLRRPRLGTYLT
jgi:GNAT superfamily N-acetyltransferase